MGEPVFRMVSNITMIKIAGAVYTLSITNGQGIDAIIGLARNYQQNSRRPLLLLARYVPRPSAEALIENGVNFIIIANHTRAIFVRRLPFVIAPLA
ncbi:MAG: hypothetical protein V7641_878 [Blastocatellia bacterium]